LQCSSNGARSLLNFNQKCAPRTGPKFAWSITRTLASRILLQRCRSRVGGWTAVAVREEPRVNQFIGEPRPIAGRSARRPVAPYRVAGTEGVCGLLAVGYHYLRQIRGHARVPVSVLIDVTVGG